jgi:hypothetical protein
MVGLPEGKGRVWHPWHRWGSDIKIYVKETECEGVDWIHLALDEWLYAWQEGSCSMRLEFVDFKD